jgi:hypothetical protein
VNERTLTVFVRARHLDLSTSTPDRWVTHYRNDLLFRTGAQWPEGNASRRSHCWIQSRALPELAWAVETPEPQGGCAVFSVATSGGTAAPQGLLRPANGWMGSKSGLSWAGMMSWVKRSWWTVREVRPSEPRVLNHRHRPAVRPCTLDRHARLLLSDRRVSTLHRPVRDETESWPNRSAAACRFSAEHL